MSEIIELTYDITTNNWIKNANNKDFITLTRINNAYQYQINFNTLGDLTVRNITRITNSIYNYNDVLIGKHLHLVMPIMLPKIHTQKLLIFILKLMGYLLIILNLSS